MQGSAGAMAAREAVAAMPPDEIPREETPGHPRPQCDYARRLRRLLCSREDVGDARDRPTVTGPD